MTILCPTVFTELAECPISWPGSRSSSSRADELTQLDHDYYPLLFFFPPLRESGEVLSQVRCTTSLSLPLSLSLSTGKPNIPGGDCSGREGEIEERGHTLASFQLGAMRSRTKGEGNQQAQESECCSVPLNRENARTHGKLSDLASLNKSLLACSKGNQFAVSHRRRSSGATEKRRDRAVRRHSPRAVIGGINKSQNNPMPAELPKAR